jgi:peptide/nickel transport system substrate-binding protein
MPDSARSNRSGTSKRSGSLVDATLFPAGIEPRRVGRRRGRLVLTAVAAASVTLVSACGGASSGSSAAATTPPARFTIGMNEIFHNLDPDQAVLEAPLQILNLVGGTLTQFNADASQVQPGLASKWSTSADGLTYTFTLRPGLTFSDGSALHASDVAASFEREVNDKANANAGVVSNWKSITAPNDTTVVMTLSHQQPSLLSLLADGELGTVSPAAGVADAKNFYLKPISAGQYQIQSFSVSDAATVLTVNPHYYGPKPAVKELDFRYINDVNTRIVQLKSGAIDMALTLPENTLNQLTGNVTGVVTPGYGGYYLYMNDRGSPLSDVNVRQAISLAIDRKQLSQTVWAGKAPALYGFEGSQFSDHENVLPTAVDTAKARQLLQGTPCAHGCNLNLMVRTGQSSDMASIVAQQLSAIGIHVSLQLTDPSIAGTNEANGKYQMEIGALYDYANRPDIMLTYGLQSDGGINALYSGYSSKQMDALIHTVYAEGGAARSAAMRQISELYGKDLPFAPLLEYAFVNGEKSSLTKWVTFEPSSYLHVATAP